MLEVRFYEKRQCQEWDQFLGGSNVPLFFFKRSFIESQASAASEKSLCVFKGNVLHAIVPGGVSEKAFISYGGLTYGGIIPASDTRNVDVRLIIDSLIFFLRNNNFSKFVYKPVPFFFHRRISQDDIHYLWMLGAQSLKRELTSVLDLTKPIRYSKGRRSTVSKGKRILPSVAFLDAVDEIYPVLEEVLNARHSVSPVHSLGNLNMLKALFPDNILFCKQMSGDLVVAGAVLFDFGDVVHCQYLFNSVKGRDLGALDVLIDQIINYSISKEKKYLSFGISTEKSGMFINEGLIQQKESFGCFSAVLETLELEL